MRTLPGGIGGTLDDDELLDALLHVGQQLEQEVVRRVGPDVALFSDRTKCHQVFLGVLVRAVVGQATGHPNEIA